MKNNSRFNMYGNVRNQQFQHNSTVLSAGPPMNSNNNGSHGSQAGAPFAQMLSLTQQPPLSQPVPAPQAFVDKLPIGLDHVPHSFNLREKVLGTASANLQYISKETGVQITLRGIGSLFVEPNTSTESQEPLHLLIEHQRFENLNSAKQLAKNLIETLHQEFLQYQQVAGPQTLPSTQIPPPQINVPPPSVIANVPPPGVSAPLSQHQQLSLVQQQFIPQNGLQMQLAQNGMIIQQQQPNLSMPPPTTTQSTMLPMKSTNQIQLQFHQPPPSTLPTQQAPIILNTQPQSIQYQYYQQTTTRDMQGNQQVTLQPFIQQTNLQSQPQYITVQQGNTAYMVPQSTLIQQAPLGTQPSTQYSIIQQQTPTTHQTAQFQMQLPLMNIQPNTQHALPTAQRLEMKNDTQIGAQDADALLQEDSNIELQVNSSSDHLNSQIVARQQQLTMPITSVPPPPLNMSVPPPVHSNLAGNAAVSNNMQQIQQPASVLVDNSNNWSQSHIPPPPLGQPLTEMHPQQAVGQQQSVAVTFTQQPLQQASQQFVQLQQHHNQQQQQQFSIIQATPLNQNNNNNNFQQQQILQFQQLQPSSIQVQQQAQYSQQQPMLLQQQQIQQQQLNFQLNQQQQLPVESSNQANNQASNVRSGQKRRSNSEQETSISGGPPPSQQIRTGMGPQSSCLNNVALTLTSAAVGNTSNVAEAVGVSGQDSPANHNSNSATTVQYSQQQQQQHHLKPTHVGVMRYNQNPQRPAYDTGYPPPRNRMTNYNNVATANQYNTRSPSQHHQQPQQQQQPQLLHNNYGQRMQFMHSQPPPPLPTTNAFGTGAGLKRMPRP